MSQLGVSFSEVVPGGTGEQRILLHTPKSSRLGILISHSSLHPTESPRSIKIRDKESTGVTMCSLCPHETTTSNPLPVPCTFRVSPFWKGSSSFSVAWKLYRATDSIGGSAGGSRGRLGLAARGAPGSALRTRRRAGRKPR